MAGLDFSGSSTSPVSLATGGNAGIQFAPRGIDSKMMLIIGAVALIGYIIYTKGKK